MARPTMPPPRCGVLKHALEPELGLQPGGGLENAALAFHFRADSPRGCNRPRLRRTPRCRGLRRISSCSVALIRSTMVRGSPAKCGSVSNSSEVGSTLVRIQIPQRRSRARAALRCSACSVASLDLLIDLMHDALQRCAGRERLRRPATSGNVITGSRAASACALGLGLVEPLVVGERVRIRPDHVRMHQRRPLPSRQ